MMYPGLWRDLAAMLGAPVLVWITATGVGLLLERVARTRLDNALLAPLGFCAVVSALLGVYSLGAGNGLALPVLLVLALAGLALQRREVQTRLWPGWPGVAGLAAYLVFNVSVFATGHWTFTGYNQLDDPAFEFLLVRHMQGYGLDLGPQAPSSAAYFLRSYLSAGYPLGTQSYLAAVAGLLHCSVAVVWQGFLSSLAGLGAMAASTLTGRVLDRRLAAVAGFLTVSAALTYQYALLGSIKEMGVLVALLSAVALIRIALLAPQGSSMVALCAVALAALLTTYSAAGLPYAVALLGSTVVAVVLVHRRLPSRAGLRPMLVGAAIFGVFSAPAAATLSVFLNVARIGYTGAHPASPALGPLFRPLPLSEISGVWLYGDYRLVIPPGVGATLTVAATVALFALMVLGTARLLVRREPGPLLILATVGLVLLIVSPRVAPYASAKLLAIGSPAVVLAAAAALAVRRRWMVPPAALVALGLGAAVLGSDVLAYHSVPVAPTDRLVAIGEPGQRLGGRGLVLDNEFEEYAKFFGLPARLNVASEPGAPAPIQLTAALDTYDHSFDLDQEPLSYVESFPYLLTRLSPVGSRAPANYRLLSRNAYYEVWQRQATPHVLGHLGLQSAFAGGAPAPCPALGRLVAHAATASRLVVAPAQSLFGFDMAAASYRSRGWALSSSGAVIPTTPGQASKAVDIPSGTYQVWVMGNFPRRVFVQLDGRTIGSLSGLNTPDSWLSSDRGDVRVASGRHVLSLLRPGGGLGPGDGGLEGSYSDVSLVRHRSAQLLSYPARSWRSLCGRTVDWIELVRPS